MAVLWLVRAMHPIAVDGARSGVGKEAVPDLVGVFGQLDALDLLLALIVEKAQLDLGRSGGEKGEVHTKPGPGRA